MSEFGQIHPPRASVDTIPSPTLDDPSPAPQAAQFSWDEFSGKALIASRTPWGTVAGGLIMWVVTKYGLSLDEATCNLLAGLGVIAASYAMRWITKEPVTGVLKARPGVVLMMRRPPGQNT